jgi:hypothetical protein
MVRLQHEPSLLMMEQPVDPDHANAPSSVWDPQDCGVTRWCVCVCSMSLIRLAHIATLAWSSQPGARIPADRPLSSNLLLDRYPSRHTAGLESGVVPLEARNRVHSATSATAVVAYQGAGPPVICRECLFAAQDETKLA